MHKVYNKHNHMNSLQSHKAQQKSTSLNNKYGKVVIPVIAGEYEEMRKVIHKQTGMMKAVKIITISNEQQKGKLLNEVQILQKLDHPNIIKIYEFYQDDRFFYIVTELCTGGELFEKIRNIGNFSEKKAAKIIKQLLSAVDYCHQEKIVHRDLKPEILFFESESDDCLLKIIDFHTSIKFDCDSFLNERVGTPYYIAPEVLKTQYNEKCDIWSCGVILYILLCGFPPFGGQTEDQITQNVVKGIYSFEEADDISDEAKLLIQRMLQYDLSKRCSALDALRDEWIVKLTN